MADLDRVVVPLEERHRKAKAAITELEGKLDAANERINAVHVVMSARKEGLTDAQAFNLIRLALDEPDEA